MHTRSAKTCWGKKKGFQTYILPSSFSYFDNKAFRAFQELHLGNFKWVKPNRSHYQTIFPPQMTTPFIACLEIHNLGHSCLRVVFISIPSYFHAWGTISRAIVNLNCWEINDNCMWIHTMIIWFIAIQTIASPRILSKGVPNDGQRIETREMDSRTWKKG
jgi:hypothetical protein